ncbi:MAG: FKBP-type peptidyl-prolyl cis-trans isomerase [Treponema sp.]|jgi:FKBP-type peptidyl-prolyl cis-trans isomerase|nr:FKBP-type peptidyl-prolyl cis-trans isomerase [Treponema sp.]
MNRKRVVLLCLAALGTVLVLGGCQKKAAPDGQGLAIDKDTSYAIGMYLASQFPIPEAHYDYDSFMEGFKAFSEAEETRFSMDEGIAKIQAIFQGIQEETAARNLEEGKAFLEENGAKPGIITTSSGLQYEVISEGAGPSPGVADTVEVNYEGTLLDGTVFDSSYVRGEPVSFPLNRVIPGWTEGLQLMSVGSTYRFFIPSDLAYGPDGMQSIPPNATLTFKVDLLSIVDTGAEADPAQ